MIYYKGFYIKEYGVFRNNWKKCHESGHEYNDIHVLKKTKFCIDVCHECMRGLAFSIDHKSIDDAKSEIDFRINNPHFRF